MDAPLHQSPSKGGIDTLSQAFLEDIGKLGYGGFDAFRINPDTLHNPASEGNWVIASYDLGVVRDYIAEGFAAICPAPIEAGRSLRPYDYLELLRSHPHSDAARWQARILKLFGVGGAWIVPLSSVGYLKGVTVYMEGRGAVLKERFEATRDEMHLRAIHFFEALEAASPTVPDDIMQSLKHLGPLTEREVECLRWAAEGKTNAEIAIIVGISENTVRYHFKNVFDRLGVRSRTQAVAVFRGGLNGRT